MENGVLERGYHWSLFDTQKPVDIIYIIKDLADSGIDISKVDHSTLFNMVFNMVADEIIKQSSYQEFKEELLPHIFHKVEEVNSMNMDEVTRGYKMNL